MNIEYTDYLLTFEDFVWKQYQIDLKGFTDEQLTDIKIQFALTFIGAPQVSWLTWANTTPWLKDPAKLIKIKYTKYPPISNTNIKKVHRNKFKRIFKTKKHV